MLVLVNTSFGYIIGERINKDNKDVLTIKEPRNLVVANDKETGQFHFAVGEIPWKPAVMNLPVNHVCFDVTEEVVKNCIVRLFPVWYLPDPATSRSRIEVSYANLPI